MKNSWIISSSLILIAFFLIYAAVGALIGAILGIFIREITWWKCAIIAFVISAIIALYAILHPVDMTREARLGEQVDALSCPRLVNTVKYLSQNGPMPHIYLVNMNIATAFAFGTPKKSYVAISRPAYEILSDDELAGVMGHELYHIVHKDIVYDTVILVYLYVLERHTAFIKYIGRLAKHMIKTIFSKEDRGEGFLYLFALIVLIPVIFFGAIISIALPPLFIVLQYGFSRSREYGADESSARLTKKPLALANALIKITNYAPAQPDDDSDLALLAPRMIVNPFSGDVDRLKKYLTNTHPPLDSRIKRLEKLDEELNKD